MRALIVPSHFEAKLLLQQLNKKTHRKFAGVDCWSGLLAGQPVAIGITGMGPPHITLRAKAFVEKIQPSEMLLIGFAGALNPELERGAVLSLQNTKRVHTVSETVSTVAEKQQLFEQTQCDLVDMESAFVEEVAMAAKLPLTIIRVVSDTASEDLPADLLAQGYDQEKGKYTPFKMACYLVTHPSAIFELQQFLKPLKEVRAALSTAVVEYLSD